MEEIKAKFISQLEESIVWHYSKYRQLATVQWCIMVLVAIAGFLTAATDPTFAQVRWYSDSGGLLVLGGATTIGAAINQFANPGKSSERHLQIKIALKSIKGAVEFRNLPVDLAERYREKAWTNPEEALLKLSEWRST